MITIDGYVFTGHYADMCRRFIEFKRSVGYRYTARSLRHVRHLNDYLSQNSIGKANGDYSLCKDLVLGYTAKKDNEAPRTQAKRETMIQQFALFLSTLGIQAYTVPWMKKPKSTFTPYIFTKEQICSILEITDNLEYQSVSPNYQYVYSLLIRMLYCCGLRISEALSLKITEIDFDERLLKINQAKFNNFRLIPMSDSLFASLEKYMKQTGYPKTDTGLLFRTRWNEGYHQYSILSQFKGFMKKANIPHTENGGLPRVHDLRHTFSVHSLESMVEQGIDMYVALPYLMVYLGHREIVHTEKYLRLTKMSYENITSAMAPLYDGLFPKAGETL